MRKEARSLLYLAVLMALFLAQPVPASGQTPQSTILASMDHPSSLNLSEGSPQVVQNGPRGNDVLQFDAGFTGTIDLEERGIQIDQYDLITLQVKADRAAFLQVSLDHYPWSGKQARWYVLDGMRGPVGWRTIWIDLRRPEEGDRKEAQSPQLTLRISGRHEDTGRSIQDQNRSMMLGEIRAVEKAVDLDWNQRRVSHTWEPGGDLTQTYPLTVTNQLDRPVTAAVSLVPVQTRYASANLSRGRVELAAHEQTTMQATVQLPAGAAERAQPLYAERFEVRARAIGIPHSTVTVLRFADPIRLTATVPAPDSALAFPLFPTPSSLPESIARFDSSLARTWVTIAPPDTLIAAAKEHGLSNSVSSDDDRRFLKVLIASAYLYDFTGKESYLNTASALLEALPEIWTIFHEKWAQQDARLISSGIVVRRGKQSHFTLRLGWRLMGTQRSPYQYSYDHNARGGRMSALFYAFDMLASELSPALRRRIVREFIVPAGIQCRNHYIGDGNQQATVNTVALYAGLAGRNWPLVSFAYSSEHGMPGILEWTFTDAGTHIRDGYQTYTMRAIFWLTELLHGRGKNIYAVYHDRLRKAVDHPEFHDGHFWNFVQNRRLSPTEPIPAPSGLSVRSPGPAAMRLEWTDHATSEAGFKIERSRSPDSGFETVATLTQYVPRYVGPCPSSGDPYYYRVRAYNYAEGPSPPSNVVRATCNRASKK